MKATDLLKQDHRAVKKLFREFESSGKESPEQGQRIFEECARELAAHTTIEEEIFYPELSAYEDTKEMIAEAVEEHHVVDVLIEEIRSIEPSDEAFAAKFTVLGENVEHHAEEEEEELFPKAEKLLGKERLAWLGERMAERKREVLGASEQGGGKARKRA